MQELQDVPCDAKRRPMAFWLQGGPHFGFSARKTLCSFLLPALRIIREAEARCNATAHVFVAGLDSQSHRLDA